MSYSTAATDVYPLALHDALPIYGELSRVLDATEGATPAMIKEIVKRATVSAIERASGNGQPQIDRANCGARSEEHTSELQSLTNLVCRLLLEKKNRTYKTTLTTR